MMPNYNELREQRVGVMLHYDASASDAGALSWLRNPDAGVSYNYLVTDDGTVHVIAPKRNRAWHAGICRPSEGSPHYADANSAFYGVSIAATVGEVATQPQFKAVVALCYQLFAENGWSVCQSHRVRSHASEAWPRGRKIDPEGPNPNRPVLSTAAVRLALAKYVPPFNWSFAP